MMSDHPILLNMLVIGREMDSKKEGKGIKSQFKQNQEPSMSELRKVLPPLMVGMGGIKVTYLKDSIFNRVDSAVS